LGAGTSLGTAGKALAYGTAAVAGASAIGGILASRGKDTKPGDLYQPVDVAKYNAPNINTSIPGVTAGKNVDLSQVKATAPQTKFQLPSGQKASASTKRQYLAQVKGKKTELNMFGGSANPLAAVG
jgi:hypothetical protein